MTCCSYPSLLTVTVMSALRLATTTHGVTQAVGLSSPDSSAVAPAGVLEMEIFSVVPRVTDAQPTHGAAIAAANTNLMIIYAPLPAKTFGQPKRECKGEPALTLRYFYRCAPDITLPAARLSSPGVTF